MPNFIVTGANGFIGNNIVERLLSWAPEKLGFDKETNSNFSNFHTNTCDQISTVIGSDLPETMTREIARRFLGSARYHYHDFEKLLEYLESLEKKPDIVIHNGACSSTTETNQNIFDKLNLNYSKALWNYCTQHQIPFIYASSAAVYGDGTLQFSDKKEDCEKYTPLNLYGKSKHDFDLWVLQQTKTPPTWFGLRYFNVFGQFESHKGGQASMVYHGYNQALRTGKIKLFKSNTPAYQDGEQKRDFIYIDDIVDITMDLIKISRERQKGESHVILPENGLFLNIGRGLAETWNTLGREVFSALSMPVSIEYISIPQNIVNQYQNYTCADLTTLRSLGIKHEFKSLHQGILKYVQKHLMRGQ